MFTSLKNQAAFDQVNKSGKKFYTPYFLTVISKNFQPKNMSTHSVFLGIKASKRLGKAHVRNKIKRRIRHIVTAIIQKIDLKQNTLGIIVVPKKGFENIKFSVLYLEFEKIFLNLI